MSHETVVFDSVVHLDLTLANATCFALRFTLRRCRQLVFYPAVVVVTSPRPSQAIFGTDSFISVIELKVLDPGGAFAVWLRIYLLRTGSLPRTVHEVSQEVSWTPSFA